MAKKGNENPWLEERPGQSQEKERKGKLDLFAHLIFFLVQREC